MQANKSNFWITFWTIVANMLIFIGLGNGTGFLVIAELILPVSIAREGISFSLNNTYSHLLTTAALLSFLGQVLLGLSIGAKRKAIKLIMSITAILLLYSGLLYLTINSGFDNDALTGLFTAVPFLCLTVLLLFSMLNGYSFRLLTAPKNKQSC